MSERAWHFYINDMIDFACKVQSYTDGLDQTGFVASGLVYDATLRDLELIGEAATRIPETIRATSPGNSLAYDHRHTKPAHSRLSGH
ncbi:HepT-like ribonuclease domain-containing protein [Alcanivorax sp. S71-1-4]|uniref:HepT-like ribonuclease domain-containing protein n=1 Tax=Alcanivorax sp. S71-1-4 TaxID=1177159 RepID=UPI0022A6E965|nr:HepT-like ribonuclease domain-containing protein [Alcanivorax sp. S71-1-4]